MTIFVGAVLFMVEAQPSKKAIRLTDKAEEAVKDRKFTDAKTLLKKAIEQDPAYGTPYLRIASIYMVYQQQDSALLYYNQYTRVTPAEKISSRLWTRIAQLNFEFGKYNLAEEAIYHVDHPDSVLFRSILFSKESTANSRELKVEPLPSTINQFKLQYFPVLTIDEQTIIFTKRDANHPGADEDIMVSMIIGEDWIPAQSISNTINTPFNEGACTISADGRTLIFTSCDGRSSFGSCDLYYARRDGNVWSKPVNLGNEVNTKYWESQPALSADGRKLYFSSNRPGGFGRRDLWVSSFKNDQWIKPVNLGKNINTKNDETTPFIHANSDVIFFSSNGHIGLGGFDLYKSEKISGRWSEPTNLGHPINSYHDELSLFINATGTHAYFAKEKSEGGKMLESLIVRYQLPQNQLIQNTSSYITGRVIDAASQKALSANIKMFNLNDSTDRYETIADPITGRYYLVLVANKEYGVFINKKNYLFEDLTFFAQDNNALQPDTVDIYLTPIDVGQELVLENIYFEFDSHNLNQKSISELKALALYLSENKGIKFRIEGHTDDVGTEAYNIELSTARAKTVYDFLLEKGIDPTRMAYTGKGSEKPIATNQSELGRKKNRRITFIVTAND